MINILLISMIVLLFLPILKKQWQSYQRQKRYSLIIQKIALLYHEAPNPYYLARQNRSDFPHNTTYGSIEIPTLLDLIADCRFSNAVFYDLGSGDAKTLMAVKLAYPHFVVRGIEIIPDLVKVGEISYHRYLQQEGLSEEQFKIDFIQDDFLNVDWSDATLIFLNATGFETLFWQKVLRQLRMLKPFTKIMITSKTLPSPFFRLVSQGMEKMSWGSTATRIYERTYAHKEGDTR